MSDFDEYIKNKYPSDYLLMTVRYPDQELSELYSDQFEVWQHQGAEIEFLKAQLSLQRDRNKALEIELTSSRNYGDGLQKRINELERGLNEVGYDSGCECCMLNQVDVREALRGEHESN